MPITLIVLGSYFVEEAPSPSSLSQANSRKAMLRTKVSTTSSLRKRFSALFSIPKRDKTANSKGKPGEGRTVFVSVVSRMIIAPLGRSPILHLRLKF